MKILRKTGEVSKIINRFLLIVKTQDLNNEYIEVSISTNLKIYEGKTLTVGDIVLFEMSPYDLTRGRLHRKTFC